MTHVEGAEDTIPTIADGTLTFRGPSSLLARPTADEIRRSLAEVTWRCEFERIHAEGQAKLGLIETRLQLLYLCSEPGTSTDLFSFARKHGVRVQSNPRPRYRRGRSTPSP